MVKVEAQGVEKRKTASFDVELVVPWTLTNTSDMNCNVFQITYEMKVTCRTKGCSIGPGVIFPITLGGVPLSFDDNMSPLTNSSICMRKSL